jgi:16S rRNA (cytosine967-C5)-methyltransferase
MSKPTHKRGPRRPPLDARGAAAQVVTSVVVDGERLDAALAKVQPALTDIRERALARELSTGVVRWHLRLSAITKKLLSRPLSDPGLSAPILLGLYQMAYTRIPVHAAVSTSVELTRNVGLGRASGLVNGVLRRFTREQEQICAAVDSDLNVRDACPPWLASALQGAWPDDWQSIVTANNNHAPLTLKVNARLTTRDAYLEALAQAGVESRATQFSKLGITLATGADPTKLPNFEDGHFVVQDEASQLCAEILSPRDGELILDACAAPGGKSIALFDHAPGINLVCVDNDESRLTRMRDNFERTATPADVRLGDALAPADWCGDEMFDRVLVDAPCTATGIIRRHPDIKMRRRAGDGERLATTQRQVLQGLWPRLAKGGTLLYSTCSVLTVENAGVIDDFVAATPDATVDEIEADWGRPAGPGRQILTGESDMDGFFYARLVKR